MGDIFVEKLVTRKNTSATIFKKILIWIALLVIVTVLFLSPLASLLAPAGIIFGGWGALTLTKRQNVEYEYALTNNELDIDMILGLKKRKTMLNLKASEIELMAPITKSYTSEFHASGVKTVYDAASSSQAPNRWFIIFNNASGKSKLIFEPDERFVEGLRRYNPMAVKTFSER